MIVQESDFFKKPYSIPSLNTDTRPSFEELIKDANQEYWIKRLLGPVEGADFISDLQSGVPQDAKYVAIFEELTFSTSNEDVFRFHGLKKQLIAVFYRQWMQMIEVSEVHTGSTKTNTIATRPSSVVDLAVAWNVVVEENRNMRLFMQENRSTYPRYIYCPLIMEAAV